MDVAPAGDGCARRSFIRAVEGRYVALRGRGYMVSAKDLELIESWFGRGVPEAVALRILEEGVRAWRRTWRRGGAPRSLAYFDGMLKAEMSRRAQLGLGAGDEEPGPADPLVLVAPLLGALDAASHAQTDDRARGAVRRAWRTLKGMTQFKSMDPWTAAAELDAELADALLALLPDGEREALEATAAAEVEAAGGARMSEAARDEQRRATLDALVRERHGLPELLEVLLEHDL